MENNSEFDDIRPYYDEEIPFVIEKLLKDPQFQTIINYIFPGEKADAFKMEMQTFTSTYDFQFKLLKNLIFDLVGKTAAELTWDGIKNVSKTGTYTYISNHRDIVLDASLLNVILLESGCNTTEIAIGDNLLLADWIKDVVRLNRSFIVKRDIPLRQVLEVSKHLSEYIHFTVRDKKQSVWIAQREGRAKDSNDRTQESLLKMLAMGRDEDFLHNLMELNMVPTAFSYEYDPCDYLKAQEFQQKRDNPNFKKTKHEDLLNMKTGLIGYKGNVHMQIGRPVNPSFGELDPSLGRNELVALAASIIDAEIFRNYKFYPINYIAYDRRWGNNSFRDKYTSNDIETVDRYFQQQLNKIDLPEKDLAYLTEKIEEMYAYPVKNFLSVSTN
jgi:hypothetical protein